MKNLRKPKTHSPKNKTITKRVVKPGGLMKFLIEELPGKSRDNIKTLLKFRQVRVDGNITAQFDFPVNPGQVVTISEKEVVREKSFSGFTIVFEDPYLIVIDKHAGVLSIASSGEKHHTAYRMLSDYVKKQDPGNKVFIVHRLDRDTSGLMMIARSEEMQLKLQDLWHSAKPVRVYIALVEGKVEQEEGTIKSYLKESRTFTGYSKQEEGEGQLAITQYRRLRSNAKYSLLEVKLETGRKNQIRIHMQDIGHCIVGDKKYGASGNPIARLGLHASRLSFIHPVTGVIMQFEIPIPRKFSRLI